MSLQSGSTNAASAGSAASDVAITTRGLSRSFGTKTVLEGVSIEIAAGTVYALLGPNGAGKTTLIRILTTLLSPSSGGATVAGADIVTEPRVVRSRIGLAGQFAAVDGHMSGRENLVMVARLYNLGRREAKRRADEVLERIHLTDAASQLVRTYSGGMRRRLDLAASMVGRPPVLFLDEPTTGVDPRSRLDIWELIAEMVDEGTTLMLTSQYLEEAEYLADRIGVIDYGTLIAEGTADELKARLGGDRIEMTVDRGVVASAVDVLGPLGPALTVDERRGTISTPAPGGMHDLNTVIAALEAAGVTPGAIGLRRPSLDDVFFSLTSPESREAGGSR
ncbi:MAG: ATP-binding cassette domain-containing protein [Acidimicrobiales bacterium]